MSKLFTLIAIITLILASGFTGNVQENKAVSWFTVDTTADTNNANLSNGVCADAQNHCSLRAAIQQVNYNQNSDNLITIPGGNYFLLSTLPILTLPVVIQGAGATGSNATVITTTSGVSAGLAFQSDSEVHGVEISNFTVGIYVSAGEGLVDECLIKGNQKGVHINGGAVPINFSITDSNIKENYKGIWMAGGTAATALIIERTNVALNEDNALGCGTGARIMGNSALLATNSTFSENTNPGNGGALCTETGGSITLDQTQVILNTAGARGGGIYINGGGTVKLKNGTQISQNQAVDGGGIFNYEGELVAESLVDAVEITDNLASNAYGGIFINRSNAGYQNRLENVIVEDNSAPEHGGVTFKNYGTLTISNSTITGNISYLSSDPAPLEGDGGGLYIECSECLTNIVNTTISANVSSRNGGGLAVKSGSVVLNNVTITANIADSDNAGTIKGSGGGIYNDAGMVTMRNSLVAGNIDNTVSMVIQGYDIDGEIRASGYNLIGGCDWLCNIATNGSGNLIGNFSAKINPRLGSLANDGLAIRYTQLFHPLMAGSPAINAGDPTGCRGLDEEILLQDQVGWSRIQADRCDIGAYESQLIILAGTKVYLPLLVK